MGKYKTKSKRQVRSAMTPELSRYFKDALDEVRKDVKTILETQHKHDKEIDKLKWKNGIMGLIGGALSAIGFKQLFQ